MFQKQKQTCMSLLNLLQNGILYSFFFLVLSFFNLFLELYEIYEEISVENFPSTQ
jgi:hypothetical protein